MNSSGAGQKTEDVIPGPLYTKVRIGSTPLDSGSSIFTFHLFVASMGDGVNLLRTDILFPVI